MAIRVCVFEDNDSLRDTFEHVLHASDELDCVGVYPDATNVVEVCTLHKPDVVMMDIDMPGINGLEATKLLKQQLPGIKVLIVTVYEDKEKIFQALCAGASGYILKKSSIIDIITAIADLHNGGAALTASVAKRVLEFFEAANYNHIIPAGNEYNLSEREKEILDRLVCGDSYKMIAAHHLISEGTVRVHINNIYKKLHVNSKGEAVAKALKERIV
jgi:DNA-binding NarL/FixJ family response regulator